ncbi:MAG: hypothetical protein LKI39_00350 [Bacteroides sp.]|nr:hypothetical protein [Bacteroides sp.]MCI1680990.1 hypothetical protein [Bacteroides sp.]
MIYKARFIFYFLFLWSSVFSVSAQDKPSLKIGGALRFNYNYSDWKPANKTRGGDFGYDMFRFNVDGSYKDILLSAEYRFYAESSGGGMLKSGWIGYRLDDSQQIQLGLTSVPFGIMPYTANSYFFNINYYLGLEDDADMGLKYLYHKKHLDLALAFFKNADILDFGETSEISADRYAYDVSGRNKEVNRGNAQLIYHWGHGWKQQLGVSAMLGGLYNLDTEKVGLYKAMALHYMVNYKNWDFRAQYTTYRMHPQNKEGESRAKVSMSAYGAPYQVAAKADTYIATLAYTFSVNRGILDSVRLYDDFSLMNKKESDFHDSYQNVLGCLVSMGPVYTYIDFAMGKNHAWLGGDWNQSFAEGEVSAGWHTRFNMNIGYYF